MLRKNNCKLYVGGEKKGHSRIQMQEEMGVSMYVSTLQKRSSKCVLKSYCCEFFFSQTGCGEYRAGCPPVPV